MQVGQSQRTVIGVSRYQVGKATENPYLSLGRPQTQTIWQDLPFKEQKTGCRIRNSFKWSY